MLLIKSQIHGGAGDVGDSGVDEETKKVFNWKQEVMEWSFAILFALVVAFIIKTFVFTLVTIDGPSMEPTLFGGERLYVNRLMYTPDNGDIVVFVPHNYPSKPYVKRVIATPGQTVSVDAANSVVYIDGEPLEESYVVGDFVRQGNMEYPLTVPEGYYFMMGDNRSNSHDSRDSDVGLVSREEITGKAIFRFWPFNRFGSLY